MIDDRSARTLRPKAGVCLPVCWSTHYHGAPSGPGSPDAPRPFQPRGWDPAALSLLSAIADEGFKSLRHDFMCIHGHLDGMQTAAAPRRWWLSNWPSKSIAARDISTNFF
jgi:hypothetical protein